MPRASIFKVLRCAQDDGWPFVCANAQLTLHCLSASHLRLLSVYVSFLERLSTIATPAPGTSPGQTPRSGEPGSTVAKEKGARVPVELQFALREVPDMC